MEQSPDVYEPEPAEPVSQTIIRALAGATDQRPIDMDLQLYDDVDPDALDKLYDESSEEGSGPRVAFDVGTHRVVVDESRRVHVATEPAGTARPGGPTATGRPATHVGQGGRGSASPWRLVFGKF